MGQYADAMALAEDATNSAGFAQENQDKWADSIQGRLNTLKATVQDFWNSFIDSGMVKGAVSGFTSIISVLDTVIDKFGSLGSLGGVLGGLALNKMGVGQSIMKSLGFGDSSDITKTTSAMTNAESVISKYNNAVATGTLTEAKWKGIMAECDETLSTHLNTVKGSQTSMSAYNVALQGSVTGYKKVSTAIQEYNKIQDSTGEQQASFIKQVGQGNTSFANYISGLEGANGSMAGYGAYLVKNTAKTLALNVATTALNMGIGMLVGVGISMVVTAIDDWVHASEKAIDAGKEAQSAIQSTSDAYKSASETVQSCSESYEKLSQGIDKTNNKNISLSTDEYSELMNIQNELADVFPSLVTGYDEQGNAILNLGSNAESATSQLQSLLETQRQIANQEVADKLPEVYKGIKEEVAQLQDEYDDVSNTSKIAKRDKQEYSNLVKDSAVDFKKSITESGSGYGDIKSKYTMSFDVDTQSVKQKDVIKQALKDMGIAVNESSKTNGYSGLAESYMLSISEPLTDSQLSELKTRVSANAQTALDEVSTTYNDSLQQESTKKAQIKTKWSELMPYVQAGLQSSSTYQGLSEDIQTTISTALTNVDFSSIEDTAKRGGGKYGDDIVGWVQDKLVTPLSNATPDVQKAFSDLFDTSITGSMSVSDYQQQIDDVASQLFTNVNDQNDFKINFGFAVEDEDGNVTSSVDKMIADVQNRTKGITNEQIKSLSMSDLETAQNLLLVDDTNITNFDQLTSAIAEATSQAQGFSDVTSQINTNLDNLGQLPDLLSESSSGGLSKESLDSFNTMFGSDAQGMLDKTATGYRINKDALADYQAQQEKDTTANYNEQLTAQVEDLNKVNAKLSEIGTDDADYSGLVSSRNGILENIDSLQDLIGQYESATSAYNDWQRALSGGEDGDNYDAMVSALENVNELQKQGLIGTEEFGKYVDMMSSKDLSTASAQDISKEWDSIKGKVDRYFTDGSDGAKQFQSDMSSVFDGFEKNADGAFKITDDGLQKLSEQSGLSTDAVTEVLEKLKDTGVEIDFTSAVEGLDSLRNDAESAKESIEKLSNNEISLNLDASTTSEITGEIDKVNEYIEQINNSDLDPNVKSARIEEANKLLDYYDAELDTLTGKDIETKVSADVSEAQSAINEFINQPFIKDDNTIVYQADVEGAEEAVTAVKNEDGTVTYTADIDGVTTTVEPITNTDGTVTYKADTSDLDRVNQMQLVAKHCAVIADDQASGVVTLWNQLSMDDKFASMSADDQASMALQVWNSLSMADKQAIIDATDNASGKADSATNALNSIPESKQSTLNANDNITATANGASSAVSSIPSLKTVSITGSISGAFSSAIANAKSMLASLGGGGKFLGTAHASGTAFAKGITDVKGNIPSNVFSNKKYRTAQDQMSLTGELGQELVVIDLPHYIVICKTNNLFNCWKSLKTIKLQHRDEISSSVNVTKVEKIYCMI